MDKKGSNKLISVYWFVILTLIAGGVIAMVSVFYSSPYDVREVEAEILALKVADCISPVGVLDPRLVSAGGWRPEFQDNFLSRCTLNFDPRGEFDFGQYYVGIEFYQLKNLKDPAFEVFGGNQNWVKDCEIEDIESKKLVKCVDKSFFSRDNSGGVYLVKILSIVRNTEKNVK